MTQLGCFRSLTKQLFQTSSNSSLQDIPFKPNHLAKSQDFYTNVSLWSTEALDNKLLVYKLRSLFVHLNARYFVEVDCTFSTVIRRRQEVVH